LAAKYDDVIQFHPPVPIDEVRKLMREHDVYVLASDAYEGWGAVVNEALEEGMRVIGTFEAGASAAMLPKERLFHCGDYKALATLLEKECKGELPPCSIGDWTAEKAAKRLVESVRGNA
jgi:glycosyltransferase involved in cell wall biosynthesis